MQIRLVLPQASNALHAGDVSPAGRSHPPSDSGLHTAALVFFECMLYYLYNQHPRIKTQQSYLCWRSVTVCVTAVCAVGTMPLVSAQSVLLAGALTLTIPLNISDAYNPANIILTSKYSPSQQLTLALQQAIANHCTLWNSLCGCFGEGNIEYYPY